MQAVGRGVPAINIGFPTRYAHNHLGVVDLDDIQNTIKLIKNVLDSVDTKIINNFR